MVTFGCAEWKASAAFFHAVMPGSWLALCHQVSVTSLPPLSWPPADDGAAALVVVAGALLAADAVVLGAVDELLALLLDFELEHAARAKAVTAAIAVALARG